MKISLNLLLSILLLAYSVSLFSQEFAPIGSEWYYSEGGGLAPPNSEFLHLETTKDTLVGSQSARIIERTYYRYSGDTIKKEPLLIYDQNDTVFVFNPEKEKFTILYIFNGEPGDTLFLHKPPFDSFGDPDTNNETYGLVIDSITSETFDEAAVNKYYFKSLSVYGFWGENSYMERIGGLHGFFPTGIALPEGGGPLRCYSDDLVNVKFSSVACDYRLINSAYMKKIDEFEIIPNPVKHTLQVYFPHSFSFIEIRDILGNSLIITQEKIIEVDELDKGLYFLILKTPGKTFTRKFIKY
ncbi:MAG: T9SS type A sorting domain-containing protein [Bacteroidales bacterium]